MKPENNKGLLHGVSNALRGLLETPLYSLGIGAYSVAVGIAALRNRKASLMKKGHRHVWADLRDKLPAGKPVVWFHAASLGEFEQGRPIIERIRRERPDLAVLLSFFSPSGYEVRKNYNGADCVVYLPFDTPGNVKRFLDITKPVAAIFIKYEFWRNYLHQLHKRNIPTYLISAVFRADQKFFRKSTSWYAEWLRWFNKIYVQDSGSRKLLEGIGIKDVEVTGDTRFDRVTDIRDARKEIPLLKRFADNRIPGSPLFMAGSSWPADEKIYLPWILAHPQVKTVIAPHEFDAGRLKLLLQQCDGKAVLLSEAEKNPAIVDDAQILIIDCFGLLSSAYAYCDIAYVGGGFGDGIHNINEAAVYGVPVFFGPNNKKFIEASELSTLGGGLPIDGRDAFARVADRLLFDPEERRQRGRWAAEYISEKTGASDIIFDQLFSKGN